MSILSSHIEVFTTSLKQVDAALVGQRTLDLKTDELLRFALSIKARSQPCVRKHFRGAKNAGASSEKLGVHQRYQGLT